MTMPSVVSTRSDISGVSANIFASELTRSEINRGSEGGTELFDSGLLSDTVRHFDERARLAWLKDDAPR